MEKLVTVATFDFVSEADTFKLLLEQEGFKVFLDNAIVGMMWGFSDPFGGIKLQVPASDAERAAEFVAKIRESKNSEEQAQ